MKRWATADPFIERIASTSITIGRPYGIRFADGRDVASAEFLGALLKGLDSK